MSDLFENITKFKTPQERVCRVSYTLNNTQPVISTFIGDQPFFYQDIEDDCLEEALFNELETLKVEVEGFSHKSEPKSDALSAFQENTKIITKGNALETLSLDDLYKTLSQSRTTQAYIEFAQQHDVEFSLSAQVTEAFYDRKAQKIFVNPNLTLENAVLLAARELRRHWQDRQGAALNPLLFHPDNAVLINRVQNADLIVAVIRSAWELQLAGYKDAWARLENSSMEDLAFVYAREANADFRSLNNGFAATAVFETWFLSERCCVQDRALIQQMLADYQGYVFDLEEARTSITPSLIAALGEMPFGKNYLAKHVQVLMRDPLFTDVRNRSNANFLWFIKFERSFRETEQELQKDVLGNAQQDKKQDLQNDDAKIISLFTEQDMQNHRLFNRDKEQTRDVSGAECFDDENIIAFRLHSER